METKSNPFLLLFTAALLTQSASAVTWQWDGGDGTGNWQTANNWNPNVVNDKFNVTIGDRLNVNGGQALIYTANEGTTNYGTSGVRGLAIGSAASTTTGTMTITGGTFSSFNAVTSGPNSGSDVIGNGGNSVGTLNINGGNFIGSQSGTDLGLNPGPTSTLNVNSGSATLTNLRMASTATVNLNGGTLALNQITKTTGTGTINFNGGTLQAVANQTDFISVGVTTAVVQAGGAIIDSGNFNIAIPKALTAGTPTSGGLTKQGTGALTLTGANTYSGGTNLNQGTLTVGTGGTLGASTGALSVNNTNSTTAGTNAVLNLATAVNTTVGSLSGTIATPTSGTNTATINNGGSARNFTVNQTAAGTYAGVIAGAGDLTLGASSANTLTLSGANTYTGATNVNGGKLIVNGNISTSSLTTVASGATLGGSGTVGKTVVNGTLAVGNSPGQMNFTDTLGLAGTTLTEIDGTSGAGVAGGHDFVNLTGVGAAGVLTYGGTMTLDIGAIFGVGTYSWNLFDMASETGTFTTIALADQYSGNLLDGDFNGVWDLTSGGNTWQFTESTGVLGLTVVPEPRAALLGGLGLLALLRRRRV